ncbi:hypothetical protein M8J76_004322 [Diaphorina citri]|nr:hypothetical protein M8J76_004322 [Diaphorina citri]
MCIVMPLSVIRSGDAFRTHKAHWDTPWCGAYDNSFFLPNVGEMPPYLEAGTKDAYAGRALLFETLEIV